MNRNTEYIWVRSYKKIFKQNLIGFIFTIKTIS